MVCAYDQNVGNTTRVIGGERGSGKFKRRRLRLRRQAFGLMTALAVLAVIAVIAG